MFTWNGYTFRGGGGGGVWGGGMGWGTLSKLSSLIGKNLIPVEANSFLLILFRRTLQ